MMMRTVTVVRQYLAAAFLIVIGLIAYGCGDTASVSEPAELGNLSVSTGTLQPPFNPATTDYRVQLSSDVSSTTITASPRVAGDTIRIDNQPTMSQTITLDSPGAEKSVSIVVTDSGAGGGSKSYTVRVRRDLEDNSLQALSVSSGTLAPSPFDKDTLNYSVNGVDASVTSITISATKSDQDSIMQIGSVTVPAGTPSGQATVQLGNTGSATSVSIDITRPSGSKKTYTVTINRGPSDNSFLQSLSLPSGLQLNPRFGSSITAYTVHVANNVTSITVTPRAQDTTARITVNGQATNSGQPSQPIPLNEPGVNPSRTNINITVIAQDNTQRVYTVTVIRDALGGNNNLSALSVRAGTTTLSLSPSPFNSNTLVYTVNVTNDVNEVAVTATRQDANASITVNGAPTNSGVARTVTLNPAGQNQSTTTIPIVVTAQNGSQKTYTVNVIRAALGGNNNLSALTVTPGPLVPPFTSGNTIYSVDVVSTVTSVTVTPTLQDPAATLTVTSNGQVTTSGQARTITLRAAGLSTTINIAVRAPNGSLNTYVITVDRAAPPPPSGNNNLSALSVRVGNTVQALSPTFDSGTTAYTVNVGSTVTNVTVTATLQDTAASMTINGQGTSSGVPSAPITLGEPGSSTDIPIVVIAPNGDRKPYTITVKKRPPAPDLIPEDDSCPLFDPPDPLDPNRCVAGSREDNITNVTTPRFRIPQPAAGETPNLYVDGNPVLETFDPVTNTLKPTAALSNGDHSITYTVTNSASLESPQSDPLTVTIDTVAPGGP